MYGLVSARCGAAGLRASPTTWCEREDELGGGPSGWWEVVAGWLALLDESRRSRRLMGHEIRTSNLEGNMRATWTDCQAAKPRLAPKERP